MESEIIRLLSQKGMSKQELVIEVERDPKIIGALVEGVASPRARVRYGCARALVEVSRTHPDWLYPHWGVFEGILGGRYRPLTWSASIIIANLAVVDKEKRFERLFDRYYALLGDDYMVTVANIVGNSPKIVKAKPDLADKVAERLLLVEGIKVGPHMTEECRRVVTEKAVKSLGEIFDMISPGEKTRAIAFVKRQVGSSRKSLADAAREFLSLHA